MMYPDSKVHGANMGPTWVLPAPDGPHAGPMNLAIRVFTYIIKGVFAGTGAIAHYCPSPSKVSYPGQYWCWGLVHDLNTLRPRQNGCYLADDIFKYIFNENVWISIKISLKFVPNEPVDNKSALVQGNGLAPNRRQAITRTNDDPVQWRINASPGVNELTFDTCRKKNEPCAWFLRRTVTTWDPFYWMYCHG